MEDFLSLVAFTRGLSCAFSKIIIVKS